MDPSGLLPSHVGRDPVGHQASSWPECRPQYRTCGHLGRPHPTQIADRRSQHENLVRLEDAPWYPALPMIISRNPLRTSSCPYGQGVDQDPGQEILGEDRPVRHAGRAYLAMLGGAVLAAAAGFVLGDSRAAPDARPVEVVTAVA